MNILVYSIKLNWIKCFFIWIWLKQCFHPLIHSFPQKWINLLVFLWIWSTYQWLVLCFSPCDPTFYPLPRPFQPLVEKSKIINKIDHLDTPPGRIVVIINSIKYTIQTLPLDEETKNLIIQYNRPFSPLSLVEES